MKSEKLADSDNYKLNIMTVEPIKEKLFSKKSEDRRSAAKQISKLRIEELANDLFVAYTKEKKDRRTWETQCEMIKALGVLDHKPALADMQTIVQLNIPHDAITIRAATTYVQLKRISIQDAQPVLELLSFGSTSVISGALYALAIDRMLPPDNEVEEIIKISWDINKHKDRIGHEFGLLDPRDYLAIACAGWNKELTNNFLNHCIETAYDISSFNKPIKNTILIDNCMKALKGKYAKVY